MKIRNFLLTVAAMSCSQMAMAGGLLTNTNQNAAYLRNLSPEASITLTSIYANPAGGAFLSKGWHLALSSQTAVQQRNIETTCPLFALNENTPGQTTHKFEGRAKAPVVPSITMSYNQDKWSVSAHFGLTGGGGKCEFDKGLGSFEALYASTMKQLLPGMIQQEAPDMVAGMLMQKGLDPASAAALAGMGTYDGELAGYGMDAYMRGRNYYFGLQVGGTYKFRDNLSGYIGVRGTYATCNYNGYVQDVKASYKMHYNLPAIPGAQDNIAGSKDLDGYNLTLNADQTGFGITPIIGIDWMVNKHWNLAAKFEAPTKMNLKNDSQMNDFAAVQASQEGNVLGQFADGKKVREDIPGILTVGAQYSPISTIRLNAGFHEYFDKSAKKYGDKQKTIDHNSYEVTAGVEYDVCKYITLSASWQNTHYSLGDAYMTDLSFNNSSNSTGVGMRIHPSKYFNIDLGYMHTFYQDHTVETPGKKDVYSRKNDVVGVSFNIAL